MIVSFQGSVIMSYVCPSLSLEEKAQIKYSHSCQQLREKASHMN